MLIWVHTFVALVRARQKCARRLEIVHSGFCVVADIVGHTVEQKLKIICQPSLIATFSQPFWLEFVRNGDRREGIRTHQNITHRF